MTIKKSRQVKAVFVAAALAVSAMLPISAAEATAKTASDYQYDIVQDSEHEPIHTSTCSYDCYSTLYGDTKTNHFRASVWAVEQDKTATPAGVIAYLYENDAVRANSRWSSDIADIHFSETTDFQLTGTVAMDGEFRIPHDDEGGTVSGGSFPVVTYNTTTEAKERKPVTSYPVNKNGETYGSYLDRYTAGRAPDLVSAVGIDGIQGYVRLEDFAPELLTLKEVQMWQSEVDKNNVIPLYNLEGTVIGEYARGAKDSQIPLSSQTLARIVSLGGDSAVLSARYDTPTAFTELYPVNAKGESYGSYLDRHEKGYAPKLISIVGDNGVSGYVYTHQFRRMGENSALNVYDLNGKVIDTYTGKADSSEEPSSSEDFSPANPLKFNTLNMRVAGKLVLREEENLTSDNGATIPSSILYTDEFGGGTTYLPVRIVTQSLSMQTEWMQDSHTLNVTLEGDQELRTFKTNFPGMSFVDPDTEEEYLTETEPKQGIGTNLIERFTHQSTETYEHTFDNLDPSKGSKFSVTITNNGNYPLKFGIGTFAGNAFVSTPTQVPAGETVTRSFEILDFKPLSEQPLTMQLGNAPGTLHDINAEISAVQFK